MVSSRHLPSGGDCNEPPPVDATKGPSCPPDVIRAARTAMNPIPLDLKDNKMASKPKHDGGVGIGYSVFPSDTILDIRQLHPAFAFCQNLQIKKSEDYGAKDFAKREYMPFDDASYGTMMHTKMGRIKSLIEKKMRRQDHNFESLKDSVADLINYASFYWAFLDENEKKENDDAPQ